MPLDDILCFFSAVLLTFSYRKSDLWVLYTDKLNLLMLTVAHTLLMHWYLHQYDILSPAITSFKYFYKVISKVFDVLLHTPRMASHISIYYTVALYFAVHHAYNMFL